MPIIADIYIRGVLGSRSNPTVKVEVLTESGTFGRTLVPSGVSTGEYEVVELRDGNKSRYLGRGVTKAVESVNEIIAPEIIEGEFSVLNQVSIDKMMVVLNGTPNRGKLDASAVLGVSIVVARATADLLGQPLYKYLGGFNGKQLPVPMMNIANGDSHSDAPTTFQEFMILPVGAATLKESLHWGTEIFHNLRSILSKHGLETTVGDEGGFAPKFEGTKDTVETVIQAIEAAGYKPSEEVFLEFGCVSSEFYENGIYDYSRFEGERGAKYTAAEQADYLERLIDKYPIIAIEGGMSKNGWSDWKRLTEHIGNHVQLVNDDLFVTGTGVLAKGIENGVGNSVLIKVDQIGTLTETSDTIEMAQKAGYTAVTSHRSGETEDTTVADITITINAGQIKTGSLSRTDRIAKYNQLLRIEDELLETAKYDGVKSFYSLDK